MKLKKDDQILVVAGKDKGKKGKISKVFPKLNKVLVPEVNIYKRHVKSQGKDKPGGIMEIVKPLSVANVVLICPKCGQATRIGYQLTKGDLPAGRQGKSRICKKCQTVI